ERRADGVLAGVLHGGCVARSVLCAEHFRSGQSPVGAASSSDQDVAVLEVRSARAAAGNLQPDGYRIIGCRVLVRRRPRNQNEREQTRETQCPNEKTAGMLHVVAHNDCLSTNVNRWRNAGRWARRPLLHLVGIPRGETIYIPRFVRNQRIFWKPEGSFQMSIRTPVDVTTMHPAPKRGRSQKQADHRNAKPT